MPSSDEDNLKAIRKNDVGAGHVKPRPVTVKPSIAPVGQRPQQQKPPRK